MARNMAIECKSIECSCKELDVWMGRLGKLCHCDKNDLKAYFLKKNIWVDSLENLGYYMESGAESSIYSSPNQKEVYKFKRDRTGNIRGLVTILKDVLNHNKCFPDTYYTLIGFSSYERDVFGTIYFGVVLRQEFKNGEFATNEQIINHLKKDGFTIIPTDANGKFIALKNGFQVTDLKSQNAIVANNRVYIIDCCITKYE